MIQPSVINLEPVFLNTVEEHIPQLNSIFLYLYLLFEIIVIALLLYYFFKTEIIFLYNNIFVKEQYSEEDKKKYNYYMSGLKSVIMTNKYCEATDNIWYPKFGDNKNMLTLDKKKISFKKEEECKKFLNIDQ